MKKYTIHAINLIVGFFLGIVVTYSLMMYERSHIVGDFENQKKLMYRTFVNQAHEKSNLMQTLSKVSQKNKQLREDLDRLYRVVCLVEKPVRLNMVQKPSKKPTIMTIPPDPKKFAIYETFIDLNPKPHFSKKEIDMTRWNKIWNCTCPLWCDCWIGKPCSIKDCKTCR